MNWPVMLRATHAAIVFDKNATVERLRDRNLELNARALAAEGALDVERSRYDDLMEKYHAIKLVGGLSPVEHNAASPKEPDPVAQAMIAKGRNSPVLMKQFRELVATRRAEGAAEADIAAEILRGVEDNEGVP